MKAITINLLKNSKGKDAAVIIYYNEGKTFTKEALIKFLDACGFSRESEELDYYDYWYVFQEAYAPGHLDEYEFCVVEINDFEDYHTWFCPDYLLSDEEVE